jgi:hypothetical protein
MAKRKKAAKAAPRIDVVEDGKKKSVRSDGSEALPKRRRVGSAQGVRMANPRTGLKEGGVPVTAGDIRDDFEAQTVSAEHNARLNRVQNNELANTSEMPLARRSQLVEQSAQVPGSRNLDSGTESPLPVRGAKSSVKPGVTPKLVGRRSAKGGTKPRGRAMGPLIPVDAETAAGAANIPASGTRPGSAPASLPDDRDGRTVTVRPGLGAPDANPAPGGRRTMRSLDDRILGRRRARNRTTGAGRNVSTESLGSLTERPTSNKSARKFAAGNAVLSVNQRRQKYALMARDTDVAVAAKSLRKNNPSPGKEAKLDDVQSALRDGHITNVEAMHLNYTHAAENIVPTTEKYYGSDKAMAHELSTTHLKGVTPEHIMSYASAKGTSVQALRNEVVNNATGQGKLTNWVVNKETGKREPFHWRASGTKQISGRDASGANITKTAEHPSEAPKGSMPHHKYIKQLIQKHVDETKLDSVPTTRSRSESVKTALWIQSQLTNKPESVKAVTQTNVLRGGDTTTQTRLVDKKSGMTLQTKGGVQAVTEPKLDSSVDNTVSSAAGSLYPSGKSGAMLVDKSGPDERGLRTSDAEIVKPKKSFTPVSRPKNTTL